MSCPRDLDHRTRGGLKAPLSQDFGQEEKWHFETEDVVSATPAVVDGVAYVGDWFGYFHALDLETGEPLWTYKDAKV